MGLFTEQEVYDMLMVLFTCVFINVTPEHGWALTNGGVQVGDIINGLIEKAYNSVNTLLPLPTVCIICISHARRSLMGSAGAGVAQEEAVAGLHAPPRGGEAAHE